jgi:8-oxo-dGTP diphosphatase
MKADKKIFYTADNIMLYGESKIVLIERLGDVPGLALVGGMQDEGESLQTTGIREGFEETGLVFEPTELFRVYAEDGRDPRGRFVTAVFIGTASGKPRDEMNLTRVRLEDIDDLPGLIPQFVFDHGKIVEDYLAYRSATMNRK